MTHTRIAVVGAGYMGGGIAQAFTRRGLPTVVVDADAERTRTAVARLHEEADRYVRDDLMSEADGAAIRQHLTGADSLAEAVADADLVIEAVSEDVDVKRKVLARVGAAAGPDTVVATNSSSIGISRLADSLEQPLVVMHWFNPAPFLPLVELAGDDDVLAPLAELLTSIGKVPVRVPDTPGFLGNRLQFALYREAALIVEEGLATPEEVDAVVSNSFGWRLPFYGPLAAGDISGLDVYAGAFDVLAAHYGERFATPDSLRAKVDVGDLGLKSSGGFRRIPAEQREALAAYRDKVFVALAKLREDLGPPPGL
ncbi:3-hydroxyacyl-CoA dehydrogenase family protein [Microlunatus sp. Y2014]|uniref:3-hydroxyacyl-CoA dehydrogenase family protein n=1 Tax=Microlunatus sp. Y2014 TaxID=3418488 RepID=UPI003DA71D70